MQPPPRPSSPQKQAMHLRATQAMIEILMARGMDVEIATACVKALGPLATFQQADEWAAGSQSPAEK